ncbi:MAG: phosphodiester glycosidase family protein [Candidatus Faecousia sp.]|nr:phosphodiester glycosidase family protein [Clostridiales bacterium]MDY6180676.1 phosphodiester glycosidase family protein [Candidatus Faecousia sp.]
MEHQPTHSRWKNLAAILVCAASLAATVFLLGKMTLWAPASGAKESARMGLADKFDRYITNGISDALSGIISIPKEYWLNDSDLVAPAPRQECYGEASDPAMLADTLAAAEELLDGQTTLFTVETPIKKDTTVKYYRDDTILAITWKQVIDGGVYTFSEVKIAHPSQFRRFLAGGEYGTGSLYTATEMAKSVNAISASSADYYTYRPYGITVNNGVTYRLDSDGILDVCFIDHRGDLLLVPRGQLVTREDVESYVSEHNVRFSLAFGPIIIQDGKECTPRAYIIGEINKNLTRAALCQLGELHYVVVTVNMEPYAVSMPTLKQFATRLWEMGIPTAYSLDGGQTATIVMEGTLINSVDYGDQRDISDIIYFATALPEVE